MKDTGWLIEPLLRPRLLNPFALVRPQSSLKFSGFSFNLQVFLGLIDSLAQWLWLFRQHGC